jgi:short-subunit dehydrogenase
LLSREGDSPLAIVTGSTTGIGLELARLLARDGYPLVLVARTQSALEQVASDLESIGSPAVTTVAADLSREGGVHRVMEVVGSRPAGILINNAGHGGAGSFAASDEAVVQSMLRLNIEALTLLAHRLLPGMIARGGGRILNVGSLAGFLPGPWHAVYYATKAYVLSLSEALAQETAGTGVTVTAFCPGPVRTPFHARAGMGNRSAGGLLPTLDADVAALAGYRAMMDGRPLVVPGLGSKLITLLVRLLPRHAVAALAGKVQRRRMS